jgi:hypothetical protein
VWLTHLRERDRASERQADTEQWSSRAVMQARLADGVEVVRWGIDWLERLERHEMVGMSLHPDTEDATEYVGFDHTRVRRVLARMVADFDA